jgi:ADP-dependent NAD(P)H-hydrate dehydratase / NAD(P)H-hydrate epimerase
LATQSALLIVDNGADNNPGLWIDCLPKRSADAHKYDRGHALVVGGYPMTGAARLAALAAARVGAGLTTVAVPEIAFPIYATALTSVMVHALANEISLDRLLAERRFSALLIGPGAGVGDVTRANALAMLATGLPTLLDADALTSFSDDMTALFSEAGSNTVLTPHEGEFARLFDIQGTKNDRALHAARQSGAVIVLKGRETVIAAPDGRIIINRNAPPTLATAGSGDVLSGIILGLLAQGMEPFMAAAAGVWMHGAAATAFGPGLIADDLPDLLPAVLRQLKQWNALTQR